MDKSEAKSAGVTRRRDLGRVWIVVLSVALALVVALIVGILIARGMGGQNGDSDTSMVSDGGLSDEEWDIVLAIRNDIYDMPFEEAIQFLDKKLEEYKGTKLEFYIYITKINCYVNNDRAAEALALAEEIDVGELRGLDLLQYYDTMWFIHGELESGETTERYRDLYMELYREIYGGDDEMEAGGPLIDESEYSGQE